MVYTIAFYVFIIAILTSLLLIKKYSKESSFLLNKKLWGLILLTVILVKCFAPDGFIAVINGGYAYCSEEYVVKHDFMESFLRWSILTIECLYMSLMISDNKKVKWIIKFIGLPILFIATAYFPISIEYFINGVRFNGIYFINEIGGAILFTAEYVLLIFACLSVAIFEDCKIEKSEVLSLIKTIVGGFILCTPFYIFGSLFGTPDIRIESFNIYHIIWIILVPIIYFGVLFTYRKEDEKTRFTMIAVMVFYLVIHFTSSYKAGFRTSRAPLQLCNLAPYLFLIVLLTKNRRILNFLSLANPVGGLIGIFIPDSGTAFSFWESHYLIQHTCVLIIPLLIINFKYMERRPFKEVIKDYFICYSIYYFSCLLINCFNNGIIYEVFGNDCLNTVNFFFLINCPIEEIFFYPYLETLRFSILGQELYLSYLLFIFIVFSLFSFILYFILEGFTKLRKITQKNKLKSI